MIKVFGSAKDFFYFLVRSSWLKTPMGKAWTSSIGIVFSSKVGRMGLSVLAQTGETVGILNGDSFQPQSW
ncbi:MAG: hypothetical protein ACXITR_08350 [Cyanobacterium sp.]